MKKNDISNLKRIGKFSQFKASVKKFHEEEEEFLQNLLYDDVIDAIWSWCFSFGEMMDDSHDFSFGEWAVFCERRSRDSQMMCQDHIPNFILVALIVFELSCLQIDLIPKLCFSDSGTSKTWRFVKISSSNFLTITIL
ncbi:hypothetical protein AVEN_165507-1 [Araneus ventricosus]|uniref:Uncharacterized protein n=1 Tax=Araneus ventricosus TaxID=182803 RepID=A0A4Y2K0Y0_ARAVE|nr:hypothetical protein AVEN_165507-1 [Araneus ventricosus]